MQRGTQGASAHRQEGANLEGHKGQQTGMLCTVPTEAAKTELRSQKPKREEFQGGGRWSASMLQREIFPEARGRHGQGVDRAFQKSLVAFPCVLDIKRSQELKRVRERN